ncbi:DUF3696 domain-containing protein [Shewanella vesiculosa]|uniref:DUF3696 domain-containing protein n=1 Tax=Shewanella vesiculosa TaxID=518738 RepID=UPI003D0333E4
MRITKLSLTNFRSFKDTQTINFAPVTLLFGPNSVGKSTVLMALFYLQQILAKGQCDPAIIDALGGKFVGGFKNLVNGRNINNSILLKLEYNKGNAIGSNYTHLTDLIGEQIDVLINSPASAAKKIAIEFEISWSKTKKAAYISNYKIWFDEIEIAEVNSDAGLKQPLVTSLNYLHPLLLPDNHDEWLINCYDNQVDIHSSLFDKVLALKNIENPSHREIAAGAEQPFENNVNGPTFTELCFVSEFHEMLNNSRLTNLNQSNFMCLMDNSTLLHVPIGIKGTNGALPLMGMTLETSLSIDDEKVDAVISELLSDVIVAPLDNLLKLLNESLCIGPLRHIPDSNYQQNPYPSQADWYNGKACWDELLTPDFTRDVEINKWLTDKNKLNLGYKLVYKTEDLEARYVLPSLNFQSVEDIMALTDALGDQLKFTVSSEDVEQNPDAEQTELDNSFIDDLRRSHDFNSKLYVGQAIDKRTISTLWDCHNNIEISASDIGVGVSQLLPLVVATQIVNKGIIACEQPELHVHPRVQVAIGDLLTQANNKASFVIETHSEHLVLRLLRRIRESTENELSDDLNRVSKEQVSIVYLEPSNKGVQVSHINIDEDGEFTSRWPSGFFGERREELF